MKKLRIRDRILLGFGLFYDYIGRHMLLAARGSYKACLFVPPKSKKQSLYNAVRQMLKTGYLEKIVKDGRPYLRITNRGQKVWQRDFSFLAMRNVPWDGKWRLIIFDLPEKRRAVRDSLRRKLQQLGFGQLQKSIYISPFDFAQDMAEFLESEHLLGYAFVLTARHELMGSAKRLANRVWRLSEINKEYAQILKRLNDVLPAPSDGAVRPSFVAASSPLMEGCSIRRQQNKLKIDDKQKRQILLRKLFFDLTDLVMRDPILPKELLPEDWLGEIARKRLLSLVWLL